MHAHVVDEVDLGGVAEEGPDHPGEDVVQKSHFAAEDLPVAGAVEHERVGADVADVEEPVDRRHPPAEEAGDEEQQPGRHHHQKTGRAPYG